jgi:hypothetical protein
LTESAYLEGEAAQFMGALFPKYCDDPIRKTDAPFGAKGHERGFMTRIAQAKAFAVAAHVGQTRKGAGAEPYTVHLEEVAALVARFGGNEAAICAGWLHDTVEDCDTTPADIETHFGAEVAAIVAQLTDDKSLEKAERKRLQVVNAPGKLPEAALVKICDKMSNIQAVGQNPPLHWGLARQMAYLDWAETVVAALPVVAKPAKAEFERRLAVARTAMATRAGARAG